LIFSERSTTSFGASSVSNLGFCTFSGISWLYFYFLTDSAAYLFLFFGGFFIEFDFSFYSLNYLSRMKSDEVFKVFALVPFI